jgi:D-xylono/L-arabinono-1,4-lactonase
METIECVATLDCEIGENPLWHSTDQKLYFVDISKGIVYSYDDSKNRCDVFCRTRVTGGFTIQEDGSFLLFQDGRLATLALDGTVRERLSGLCPGNQRFNDVIADPEGRVFAGAMEGNGRLFRFDPDGRVTELFDGIGVPNGMGFTPDLRGMYFIDSPARTIYLFDYERATGSLSNRRVFAEIPLDEGLPDGMTVDADGYVWTAIWFGSRLKRFAPDGSLDRDVFLPATQISSVTFGGRNLTDIYVTSTASTTADRWRPSTCDARAFRGGGVYRVRGPGLRGKLPFRSGLRFP